MERAFVKTHFEKFEIEDLIGRKYSPQHAANIGAYTQAKIKEQYINFFSKT